MPNLVSRARRYACALRALWEPVPTSASLAVLALSREGNEVLSASNRVRDLIANIVEESHMDPAVWLLEARGSEGFIVPACRRHR
jgi:hypothetical protein